MMRSFMSLAVINSNGWVPPPHNVVAVVQLLKAFNGPSMDLLSVGQVATRAARTEVEQTTGNCGQRAMRTGMTT